jgi:plastocyanin
MRQLTMLIMSGALAASLLAGCDDNNPTSPNTGGGGATTPTTPAPTTPPADSTGGGGGATTPAPAAPAPATAAVTVGDIFFKSALNGSSNPAVDTVAVNGTVTWNWSGSLPHSVQSMGSPSFTSSAIQAGSGKSYQFQFTTPGTYQYDCAVHGTMMTGTIVVMAASGSSSSSPPPSSTPPPSTPSPTGY